jgi:hypothetical protein
MKGMVAMIAMLAILGLVFLAYDVRLVYGGEVNLARHVPFIVPISCALWIAGLIWADKKLSGR